MTCLFTKSGRRGVLVLLAFDGPGVDCGRNVCVAFGEVFAVGPALYNFVVSFVNDYGRFFIRGECSY